MGTSRDTNWDPAGLWLGIAELLPLVDVLLPNRAEMAAIAAAASPSGDAAGLAALGARLVVKGGTAAQPSLESLRSIVDGSA